MSSLVLYRFGYNATVLWTLRVNCIYVAHRCLLLEGVNLLLRCPPMLTQASAGNLLERPPTGAHLVAILLNEHCSFALLLLQLFSFALLHFFHFAVLHFYAHLLLLICSLCSSSPLHFTAPCSHLHCSVIERCTAGQSSSSKALPSANCSDMPILKSTRWE